MYRADSIITTYEMIRVGGDTAHAHSVNFLSEKIPTKRVIHETWNFWYEALTKMECLFDFQTDCRWR